MAKRQTFGARALADCKRLGWEACIVERHNTFSNTKHDAFGFGDILAIDDVGTGAVLIQVCRRDEMSKRWNKIACDCVPASSLWLGCGNRIEIWGYDQPNGKGSRWRLKRQRVIGGIDEGFEREEVEG